jgi:hypothetical protein
MRRYYILAAASIATAAFAGSAQAHDFNNGTATATPTSVTISGHTNDSRCRIEIDVWDDATERQVLDQIVYVAADASGDFSFTFAGPNDALDTNDGSTDSIVPSTTYSWEFFACDDSPNVPNGVITTPAAVANTMKPKSGPDRAGYCLNGVFENLALGQPATDPAYKGATPAFYVDGVGITCDPPGGAFTQAVGDTVGPDGTSTGANAPGDIYPHYKKAG